jgi:hypothetical protein
MKNLIKKLSNVTTSNTSFLIMNTLYGAWAVENGKYGSAFITLIIAILLISKRESFKSE